MWLVGETRHSPGVRWVLPSLFSFRRQEAAYCLPVEGWGPGRGFLYPLSPPTFFPAGVGKSSLLLRFADNTFSGECAAGCSV